MAVRNYVGARYVPKFATPVEWQANTSYEALVIVTYNNASYTSRIPVPPTVGNPAENDKYWALTGNYNAQIEEYRQDALEVKNEAQEVKNEVQTEITNFKNTIDDLYKNLCIASSFEGSTDLQILQNAINYATENNMRGVLIDRKFDITGGTLMFNLPEVDSSGDRSDRRLLRLVGVGSGEIYKGDSGYMFDGNNIVHGLCTINLRMTGNKSVSADKRCDVFNARTCIRGTAINCYFNYLRNVFRATSGAHTVMQSWRTYANTVQEVNAYLYSTSTITDCTFDGDTIENSNNGLVVESTTEPITLLGFHLCNAVIEGMTNEAIKFTGTELINAVGFNLDNDYFEENKDGAMLYLNARLSGSISNCTFSYNSQSTSSAISLLYPVNNRLTLIGNQCSNTQPFINFLGTQSGKYCILWLGNNAVEPTSTAIWTPKELYLPETATGDGSVVISAVPLNIADTAEKITAFNVNHPEQYVSCILYSKDGTNAGLTQAAKTYNTLDITAQNIYGTLAFNTTDPVFVITEAIKPTVDE